MKLTRRETCTARPAAAGARGGRCSAGPRAFAQDALTFTPEAGATLRLLRWSPFVKATRTPGSPTPRFTDATGVRCASTRKAGRTSARRPRWPPMSAPAPTSCWSGSTTRTSIPTSCSTSPTSATTSAPSTAAGIDGPKDYATRDGKFIGLPLAAIGNAIVYRDSWVQGSRLLEFPKDTAGFLELCKALQKIGHPAGFTHGQASATATTTPTGCCGAMAARWSTRAARSSSTAPRR